MSLGRWMALIIMVIVGVVVAGLFWPSAESVPSVPSVVPSVVTTGTPSPVYIPPEEPPVVTTTTTTPIPVITGRAGHTINPTSTVYVGEVHLNVESLSANGNPITLIKYVNDDPTRAVIYSIKVPDMRDFNLNSAVPYYGKYFVTSGHLPEGDQYYIDIEPSTGG